MNTEFTALTSWMTMWAVAGGLFLAAKTLTLAVPRTHRPGSRRLAYLLLWPGMDLRAFFQPPVRHHIPMRNWLAGIEKICFGAALIWIVLPRLGEGYPLTRGWIGMIGLICVLHFGLFDLLALWWRARGVPVQPIMQAPATATSLAKFWGGRWNRAFSELMHRHLFKPLAFRWGAGPAMFLVFGASGALHELVISFPAGGGYGLPTLYFLLQAGGLWFERSRLGRRLGLGAGWRGWCFVAVIAGVPAFWLFHPIFVHHVILPMLAAMGA